MSRLVRNLYRIAFCGGWLALAGPAHALTITIDGSQTNQVIDGFGVNHNYQGWTNDDLKPVIDALIDQGNMTLFRVVFNNTDWEGTNDNSDSTVMNWDYYNTIYSSPPFEQLWGPHCVSGTKRESRTAPSLISRVTVRIDGWRSAGTRL